MLRKSKMSIPWQMICVTALFFAVTSATAAEPEVTPVEFDGILPLRPRRLPPPECVPGMPIMPGIPGVPGTPGITPETPPNQMNPMLPQTADSGDSGGRGSALASGSLAFADPGGYLDNARPTTMFRVRYDAMFGFNQPDRSEFFLAAWREISFHPHGILNQTGTFISTPLNGGKGMDPIAESMNIQETSAYFEYARSNRFSVFAEIPFRMLDITHAFHDNDAALNPSPAEPGSPDPHESLEDAQTNAGGLGDIVLGFKYALLADPARYLTFQFSAFFPTGNSRNGLGTGHYSLEPALLYSRRITDRLSFQSEFKSWIPLGGTESADGTRWDGVVLTWGGGLGYDIFQRGSFRITPLLEIVGWTVINGFETVISPDNSPLNFIGGVPPDHGVEPNGITNIVNLKLGVRTYLSANDDFYLGFGQALTTDRWYNEIARIEYRRTW